MSTRSQGNLGEDHAVIFLKSKNYKILERNFRSKFGEIDIIARDGKCLVFCEVKMRSTHVFGTPGEAITLTKLQKIILTLNWYMQTKNVEGQEFRVDAIEILNIDGGAKINHIQNITM